MSKEVELPRWRCEVFGSHDKNLIAKFLRAASAQDAVIMARNIYGCTCAITVLPDRDKN